MEFAAISEIIKYLEKLGDSKKNRVKDVRQTGVNFTDREIIGSSGDKPKASLLIELLGCSINDFGKKQWFVPETAGVAN